MIRILPAVLLLCLCGCKAIPDSYPPPIQREPIAGALPDAVGPLVNMSDPNAEEYIVKDVAKWLEGGSWRWCNLRPELRFRLPKTAGWKFTMSFSIVDATFKTTGPVTLTFLVNGHALDKVRYTQPGEYVFEKPVPAEWLRAKEDNHVAVESAPHWTSPSDHVVLTFTLTRAGFIE